MHSPHQVQMLEAPPFFVQISKQYTAVEPARSLYAAVQEVMAWPGILSASTAMGFYYADVPEMGTTFVAVADGDVVLARRAARCQPTSRVTVAGLARLCEPW